MEENHYIEWIEILADDMVFVKFLKPGDELEAEFEVGAEKPAAREYCGVHGLWKKQPSTSKTYYPHFSSFGEDCRL